MSLLIPVPNPIAPADITVLETSLANTQSVLDKSAILISSDQAAEIITVSTTRFSEIEVIDTKMINVFPNNLPKQFDAAEHTAKIAYVNKLEQIHAQHLAQANQLELIINIEKNNLYINSRKVNDQMVLDAKHDAKLAEVVAEVKAEFHGKGGAHHIASAQTINADTSLTVSNVLTGKLLTNTSHAVLSIVNPFGDANEVLQVFPGSAVLIPTGWHNIKITNLSKTELGSFNIFLKH